MALLLIFFAVSIIFSFLCSLWEASLLTIPPSYVERVSQQNTETGKLLKQYKTNVDRPLSAILTLNTIAHTVGAIGVGAQATKVWPGNELITGLIVPVVMTLAILILSEIIPKTYGATRWRSLVGFTVKSLRIIQLLLSPLVWLSEKITRGIKGKESTVTVTRTDMAALASLSHREGVLDQSESQVMHNLLTFREVTAHDIMTPRTVLHLVPESMTVSEYLDQHPDLRFSRIPIFDGSRDKIESYVLKDTILLSAYKGDGAAPLRKFGRPIIAFEETTPIPQLLDTLLKKREHIGLVLDEFGGTAGVVTQEDVIETLLGLEIVDESDRTEDMQALARKLSSARNAQLQVQRREPSPATKAEITEALEGSTPLLGLTGQSVPIDDSGDEEVAR